MLVGIKTYIMLSKMVVENETDEESLKKHAELVLGVNPIELILSLLLHVQVLLTYTINYSNWRNKRIQN